MTATSVFSSRADDFRLKFAAVLELHLDAVRALEDVIVGENVAVRPNDEIPSLRFAAVRNRGARRADYFHPVDFEKEDHRATKFVPIGFLCHFDNDHARGDNLEHFGKSVVELMHHIFSRLRRRGGNSWSRTRFRGRTAQARARSEAPSEKNQQQN